MITRLAFAIVALTAVAGSALQTPDANRPDGVSAAERTTKRSLEACPWPASLDAVRAAPAIHKVVFENEHVRVLQVTIPPHSKEPIHTHCFPGTLYIQQAGDIIDRDAQGRILFDSRQLKVKPKAPFVEWSPPEAPHSVENLDASPLKLIRVENKD